MTDIVKRNARAILLDGDELVLIKRTKPGREPYWVSVGGGVEDDDPTIEDALHREVFEELGGKLDRAELVHLITDELESGIGVQHIFAARLAGHFNQYIEISDHGERFRFGREPDGCAAARWTWDDLN